MRKSPDHLAYRANERYTGFNCEKMVCVVTRPITTLEMIDAVIWGFDNFGFDAFVLYNQPMDWTRDDLMTCFQEMLCDDGDSNVAEREFYFRNREAATIFKLQWS